MTDCFNCHKALIDHSEGSLNKCLAVLSRALEHNFTINLDKEYK